MAGTQYWSRALEIDTSEDVHVAETGGRYVFYTEESEAFIRTERVVDVTAHR